MDHHRSHADHQPLVLQRVYEAGALSGPYRRYLALGLHFIFKLAQFHTLALFVFLLLFSNWPWMDYPFPTLQDGFVICS